MTDTTGFTCADYKLPLQYDNDVIRKMEEIKGEWLENLRVLRCSGGQRSEADEKEMEVFTRFLIGAQRNELGPRNHHGCWALPEDVNIPSDARVDFIYMPTYIALAWLTLIKADYPHISESIDGFDRALSIGFNAATGRKLRGHGYEGDKEMVQAIEILSLGKVFSFIAKHRHISLRFYRVVAEARERLERLLAERDKRSWGYVPSHDLRRALALLSGDDDGEQPVCYPVYRNWERQDSNKQIPLHYSSYKSQEQRDTEDLYENLANMIWDDLQNNHHNKITEALALHLDTLAGHVGKQSASREKNPAVTSDFGELLVEYDLVAEIEKIMAEIDDPCSWIGKLEREFIVERVIANLNHKLPVLIRHEEKPPLDHKTAIRLASIKGCKYNYETERWDLCCDVGVPVKRPENSDNRTVQCTR